MQQGSEEWFAERRGRVTASRIADVMAKTKSGYSASRENYMVELALERLTGITATRYVTPPMLRGIELEPQARAWYEFETNQTVEQVGFIKHPTLEAGASPDGLVAEGCVEFKCPNAATHFEFLETLKIPQKYIYQMQFGMLCTDKPWQDYVSYNPDFPVGLHGKIVRVEEDPDLQVKIESEVAGFLEELEQRLAAIGEKYGHH